MSAKACFHPDQGMAYVALLFILIIILAMGLSFLLRAATEAAAVENAVEGMQSEYAAEAAVHHAVWRLLYDPSIPSFADAEAADEYNMVNFDSFRYGYNFRPNTTTTMATVRTVGVADQAVLTQGWIVNMASLPFEGILCLYGRNNVNTLRYRNYVDPDWANVLDAANVAAEVRWVALAASPITTEAFMLSIDSQNDVNISKFDGSTWGTPWEFTVSADDNYRCAGIAYESLSGQAMVAGRYVNGRNPYYCTWNGTSWSGTPTILTNNYGSGDIRHTVLRSDPLSDELILVFLTSGGDIVGQLWNGTAWSGGALLTASAATTAYRPVNIAYEQQSSEALILYLNVDNSVGYATWNGVSLAQGTAMVLGNDGYIVRMASHKESNAIIAGILDRDSDASVCVWNGTSWIHSSEIDTSVSINTRLAIDVCWEDQGDEAIVFYGRNGLDNLYYRRWDNNAQTLSAMQTGPNFGGEVHSIQTLTISGSDRIIVLAGNDVNDMKYVLWGGDGFEISTPVLLDDDIFSMGHQGFELTGLLIN